MHSIEKHCMSFSCLLYPPRSCVAFWQLKLWEWFLFILQTPWYIVFLVDYSKICTGCWLKLDWILDSNYWYLYKCLNRKNVLLIILYVSYWIDMNCSQVILSLRDQWEIIFFVKVLLTLLGVSVKSHWHLLSIVTHRQKN